MITRMSDRMPARTLLIVALAVLIPLAVVGFILARAVAANATEAGAVAPPEAAPTPCPVDFKAPFVDGQAGWHEEPVPAPKKMAWEESLGGKDAARASVRARLRALPERVLAADRTLPSDDRALLERVARDTWRGIDAFTDRENGLPVDNVRVLPPDAKAPAADAKPATDAKPAKKAAATAPEPAVKPAQVSSAPSRSLAGPSKAPRKKAAPPPEPAS